MAKTQQGKQLLGMAGEYSVCAELLKRGYNASITMGNAKAVDIVVFMQDKTYRKIEVKTSQGSSIVTNFFQKYFDKSQGDHPDFWILVHIDSLLNSRYFILTHEQMGNIQMSSNKMNNWEKVEKGCDKVLLVDLAQFENRWEKIC